MNPMRNVRTAVVTLLCAACFSGAAGAATLTIDWLNMSPTAINSPVPNASVFNVVGIGNVTVTKSIGANVSDARATSPSFVSGSFVFGLNTYQWSNFEYFGTILNSGPDPIVPILSTVTYTFPSVLTPGTVYVGILGLGATTSFGGGASTMTVNQNGTLLGDYPGGGGFGPSLFTPGAGTFTVQNSVTGPGGQDPHWNSQMAVIRIDDPVSSITIQHLGLRGDGIGASVGFIRDVVTPVGTSTWGRIKSLYR